MLARLNNHIYKSLVTAALACCSSFSLVACISLTETTIAEDPQNHTHYLKWADPQIDSLADLSIEALRARPYGSSIHLESRLDTGLNAAAYRQQFSADGSPSYHSYMASYDSDGLRVYTRVDIPASAPPANGYPVMVFAHGWEGIEAAPGFDFGYKAESLYSRYIDAFVDSGFLVLTPGFRGHGTVDGVAAEGIEFLRTWDNGSYISPVFYAIDVLNLIDGIQTLDTVNWDEWGYRERETPRANTNIIHINGHSQGGDAALIALAVSGEGSALNNSASSGSIWSGCFGARFDQVHIYGPMASTLQAFMSGDGTWTDSAIGLYGSVNPSFVFAWPPDWIGTLDTKSPAWTWQADNWKLKTVADSLEAKFTQMYEAVNQNVAEINDATFELTRNDDGYIEIRHDPRITTAMADIGAYNAEQYLLEPLLLHHSDQDYYSIPAWNTDLSKKVNAIGGYALDLTYPGNTHSLLVSKHEWFSPRGTTEGFLGMLRRDLELQQQIMAE